MRSDLVEGCQISVGERREENVLLKIVAALVKIKHDALKLQIHFEDSGGDKPPDAEAIFLARRKSCALLKTRKLSQACSYHYIQLLYYLSLLLLLSLQL
jgi:hypothetical protein